jgi:hypothetical protein
VVLTLRHDTARATHLDRFAWRAGFSLDAHGMLIGLRASDTVALPALRRMVPPGARVSDAGVVDSLYSLVVANDRERMHILYEDADCAERSADFDELLVAFQSRLHFKVAVGARTRLFVHAGVVGWHGGAILIPGRTHTGKSSLVAALVRAGATYYSDEYAVLDDQGLVHPFARALGIRDATGRTRHVEASALGASIGDVPLPVRMVVVTKFVSGAEWRPRQLSPGETVLALLENTLAVRTRPADALRILGAAVTGMDALQGDRGDATQLAEQILARCPTHTR